MVMEATRPASRILAMLELLQDRPGMSGPQLADSLGVTTRTIRRYVTTLQDMGIPVEPTAGRIGGYWLRPGYRMPPLMFSSEEAIGLAVTLLTARVSGEEQLPVPVANALAKIERSLPQDLAKRIATIRDGFRMARDPWPDEGAFPNPEILAIVIQAIAGEAAIVDSLRQLRRRPDLARCRSLGCPLPRWPLVPPRLVPVAERAAHLPDRPDPAGGHACRCRPPGTGRVRYRGSGAALDRDHARRRRFRPGDRGDRRRRSSVTCGHQWRSWSRCPMAGPARGAQPTTPTGWGHG